MIRSFHAEWLKLARPTVRYGAGAVIPLLCILATVLDFSTATTGTPMANPVGGKSVLVTVDQLASAQGMTTGFTNAATFVGTLVFVLFITSTTSEFGQGTLRALLLQQPARLRLLLGKTLALLTFTALVLLASEIVSVGVALAMARVKNISVSPWFSSDGLLHALSAYGNVVATAGMFGVAGVALGVLLRSTPIALGVGLAWTGPLEHILQLSWTHAGDWSPGLLFDEVGSGGGASTGYHWAWGGGLAYTAVLLLGAALVFSRRDVTN